MTCIVAIADGNAVEMGADSAAVAGFDLTVRADPKIFRVGPALIGFTTSFRMGQLLGFCLSIPAWDRDTDLLRYMAVDFVDAVRACLKVGGYSKIENNREEAGTFLVGLHGRVFRIESDFQVSEARHGYDACGCGAPYALGALRNSSGIHRDRVRNALATAFEFSAGVRPPFDFLSMTDRDPQHFSDEDEW